MSSRDETTLPATRPRSRKSLAHLPSGDIMDKENVTADIGTRRSPQKSLNRPLKKSRSKSIGPGGLDALKNTTGNRRMSIATPQPKSILKPTMPPLQEIPAHGASRKTSPKDAPQLTASRDTLNESKSLRENSLGHPLSISETIDIPNPFATEPSSVINETRVLLRTEEQQEAATREREDRQNSDRAADLETRREARRKSLANRRVSFAPEATLHTWDVVEYLQDSTVSSESTNSTRRASSASGGTIGSPRTQAPGSLDSDPSESPSTPPDQVDETLVHSPAHQRDLHQKRRRRSSGIPPLNFNNPDDETFFSSPSSGSSTAGDEDVIPGFAGDDGDDASDSNSDSENEGTAMSLDVGNNTDMSIVSARSASSTTGSSARLEEALQLAARQASAQGVDFDEHGDMKAVQNEEVVAQFQPWTKVQILSPSQDQENLNPFSRAFKAGMTTEDSGDEGECITMEMAQVVGRTMPQVQPDEEITMEMTASVGGIMQALPDTAIVHVPKHSLTSRRQSNRRRSSAESSGDQTMDLTMAIGGIQQVEEMNITQGNIMEDEDMSMELTSVIDGVLAPGKVVSATNQSRRLSLARRRSSQHKKRESLNGTVADETMDMTRAVGAIVSTKSRVYGRDETVDIDIETDMKMAVGGILPKRSGGDGELLGRSEGQYTADNADIMSSPSHAIFSLISLSRAPAVTVASETGSPSLAAFRGKGLRRSGVRSTSTTPKSNKKASSIGTPTEKPSTPSKQFASKRAGVTKGITMQSLSPNQIGPSQSVTEGNAVIHSASKRSSATNQLFQKNNTTGAPVPNIVLTPKKRRSSGIGVDRTGLGSPNVAALLDRRESIGEKAIVFTSGSFANTARGVHFCDFQMIEKDVDIERQEDLDREDGRKIMEREADIAEEEKDATINLKEMIQSLTPKKRPLNGRKSLHVGAARGILGKRPAELDQDDQDNDDDTDGVKRLKDHEGSPVKNVKLKAPPSKAETTGRLTRAARRSLQDNTENATTPTMASSPDKALAATTPKGQGRFRDSKASSSVEAVVPFVEKPPLDNPVIDEEYDDERIQLQEFLNMTSIRFMELTTTKRRHTVVPKDSIGISRYENSLGDTSFESCVVAGACTVPMLELFQHSCRELKKYISEGRGIVREIETETFEENPPLFREYISASPDVRVLMDNQFKNVKTHARLLSKAMWYEWRMKLLEGLKDGLLKIRDGMEGDAEILQHQQELLDDCVPPLIETYDKMAEERADLQQIADELADCNQEELIDARQKLVSVETDVEAKQRMIQDLRNRLQEKEADISAINEKKQTCLGDIEAAEMIREACRGWSASEGLTFKAKVDGLEKRHGWAITGVVGSQVSLTYRRDIELVFDASSFKPNTHCSGAPSQFTSSRIDLWYIAVARELNPMSLTIEKDFFLQNIRECCRSLPQARTTVRELLDSVSASWTSSLGVVDNIQSVNRVYPTEVTKTSDSSILVRSTLLLLPLGTKVVTEFKVVAQSTQDGLELKVEPSCTVLYGERFNEAKMAEFLASKTTGYGKEKISWGNIVTELEEKLLARGRKL